MKPRLFLQKLAASPRGVALLYEGDTGSGKTAMALAFASEIPAQVHRLPASECTRDNVAGLWMICQSKPRADYRMHLVLVDHADLLRESQQMDLRSKIDSPELLDDVVWVFTAIPATTLDPGFRSRCVQLKFSTYGNSKAAAEFLEGVWRTEAPSSPAPNFARIIKEANGDIRAALGEIELKLMTV